MKSIHELTKEECLAEYEEINKKISDLDKSYWQQVNEFRRRQHQVLFRLNEFTDFEVI